MILYNFPQASSLSNWNFVVGKMIEFRSNDVSGERFSSTKGGQLSFNIHFVFGKKIKFIPHNIKK